MSRFLLSKRATFIGSFLLLVLSAFIFQKTYAAVAIGDVSSGSITDTTAVISGTTSGGVTDASIWFGYKSNFSEGQYQKLCGYQKTAPTTFGYPGFITSVTATVDAGTGNFSATLTDLSPGVTYWYRVKVAGSGTATSSYYSFTTTGSKTIDTTAPVAPSLTLSSAASTSLTIKWNATGDDGMGGGNVAGYKVWYSTSAANIDTIFWNPRTEFTHSLTPVAPGSEQTLTITGLQASTAYRILVCPFDDANNTPEGGGISSNFSTTAAPSTPSAPTLVSLTPTSPTSFTIVWNPSTGATNDTLYSVNYRTTSPFNSNESDITAYEIDSTNNATTAGSFAHNPSTTQYSQVITVPSTNTYYVHVRACTPGVPCSRYATNSVTLSPAAPSSPGSFTATSATATSVQLAWTAPSSGQVTAYKLRYRTDQAVSDSNWDTGSPSSREFASGERSASIIGLTTNTRYYFGLRACSSSTVCSAPFPAEAIPTAAETPVTTPTTPTTPTSLRVASSPAPTSTGLTVEWTTPSSNVGTRYVIRYTTGTIASVSESQWASMGGTTSVTPTDGRVAITGLTANTTYTFALRAYADGTDAYPSSIVSTSGATAPSGGGSGEDIAGPPISSIAEPTEFSVVGPPGQTSLTLQWRLPSIAGPTYQVTAKYRTGSTFANADWASAQAVTFSGSPPSSSSPNTLVSGMVTGLTSGTSYTFALKATDGSGSSALVTLSVATSSGSDTSGTCNVDPSQYGTEGACRTAGCTWCAGTSTCRAGSNACETTSSTCNVDPSQYRTESTCRSGGCSWCSTTNTCGPCGNPSSTCGAGSNLGYCNTQSTCTGAGGKWCAPMSGGTQYGCASSCGSEQPTTPTSSGTCGDGTCRSGESKYSCSIDCGIAPEYAARCGSKLPQRVCDQGEDWANCHLDCDKGSTQPSSTCGAGSNLGYCNTQSTCTGAGGKWCAPMSGGTQYGCASSCGSEQPTTQTTNCPNLLVPVYVCGESQGRRQVFGSRCELDKAGWAYVQNGQCPVVQTTTQTTTTTTTETANCSQEFVPVCGTDGKTYPNECVAVRSTRILRPGRCEETQAQTETTISEVGRATAEDENVILAGQTFLRTLSSTIVKITQFVATVSNSEGQKAAKTLQTEAEKQYEELKMAVAVGDVKKIKPLNLGLNEFFTNVNDKLQGLVKQYSSSLIERTQEQTRELSQTVATSTTQITTPFGDDPALLQAKLQKQQGLLSRAKYAFKQGYKDRAVKLFEEAQTVVQSERYVISSTDNTFVDTQNLGNVLQDVRNGMNAAWDGINRMKSEGVTPAAELVGTLEQAEKIYQEASVALAAGKNEEVRGFIDTLNKLGLQEKFANFRSGAGRQGLSKDRIEDFLKEAREQRALMEKGIPELARRGVDVSSVKPILTRLDELIDKARAAFTIDDKVLGLQFLDEIRSMRIGEIMDRMFQNLNQEDLAKGLKQTLTQIPETLEKMRKVIEERRAKGDDVTRHEALLATVEREQNNAQSSLDRSDVPGASTAVQAMVEAGLRFSDLPGIPRRDRQETVSNFTLEASNLSNVTFLGKKATKDYNAFIEKTVSVGDRMSVASTMSEFSPDVIQKLLDSRKRYQQEIRSIMQQAPLLPEGIRAQFIESNLDVLDELQSMDGARKSLSRIKGVKRAALQKVDALKERLADYNFPPETAALVVKRLETFADTLNAGTIVDAEELTAYVDAFNKEVDSYFKQALNEKYEKQMIPARNIDDTNRVYEEAMILRSADALQVLFTKNDEVNLAKKIDGKTFEKFLEEAVDENVLTGTDAKRVKRLRTLRVLEAIRYIVKAYDIEVPKNVLSNQKRLTSFMKTELDVSLKVGELQKPLTNERAVELLGNAEDKFGTSVPTQVQ